MNQETIKKMIRDWFATLSIEELTSNQKVVHLFEAIERYLLKHEVEVL